MSLRKVVFFICVAVSITGCKQAYLKPENRIQESGFQHPLSVDVIVDTESLLKTEYREEADDIMNSAMAAAYAHRSTPVSSHGEGLALYAFSVLAVNMVESSAELSLQKEAEKKAGSMLAFVDSWKSQLFDDVDFEGFLQHKNWIVEENAELILNLEPTLKLSSDHQVLSVHLVAEVQQQLSSKKRTALYLNEFEYRSKPLASSEPLKDWLEDRGARLKEFGVNGFQQVLTMMDMDMKNEYLIPEKAKTIRYENSSGRFLERGFILEESADRLLYQTLRGGLKSVHVSN